MRRLSSLLTKRPVIISLVCLVAMLAMIIGAMKMNLATGNETLMSTGSKVYQDNEQLEKYFGGESIILLSTSDRDNGILTVENLQRMKELDGLLGNYKEIYSVVSPVSLLEQLTSRQFEKKKMSGGLADATLGLTGNQGTLNMLLYEQGKLRPVFRELILNDRQSVMIVKLKGQIDDQGKTKIIDAIKEQLDKSPFEGVDTVVTGKPVMDAAVHDSMQSSMKVMIGIAVFAMLIVLSFVFRVRWRVIAIPVILLAVFATLGLMGHVGIPMTMVSMAVFPILIGLGVDYAIQFQNRYEEEYKLALLEQGEG